MLSAPILRVATPDDAEAVEHVCRQSFPVLMAGSYSDETLARVLPLFTRANPALLSSGTYYLAEVDGEVVACGGWSRERPGTGSIRPGVAHIRHFATAAAWIGRGHGRALYQRCEQEATRTGVQTFECYASYNGAPFYEALGFRRVALMSLTLGHQNEIDCIHMQRDLSS